MSSIDNLARTFGEVAENSIDLDRSVTTSICEGMNIILASFQALYLQYEKHHFVVEGSEFASLHQLFQESYQAVRSHIHEIGERLNGLGGVPVANLAKLAELSCFSPEEDGVYPSRSMVEHDLSAEQSLVFALRRQAAQAEGLGDRATRYLYEQILLATEERSFHLNHLLAHDSLTTAFVGQ